MNCRNCVITRRKRTGRGREESLRDAGLQTEGHWPPESKGTSPSFALLFWVSFCFACFLPFQSDVPGWFVVCPCPRGGPGMVMCSALHYLWSPQRTSQRGGSERAQGQEACARAAPWNCRRHVLHVTSEWLPLALFPALALVNSPRSAPSRQPGFMPAHPSCLAKLVLERSFPHASGLPGGSPRDSHCRHLTV